MSGNNSRASLLSGLRTGGVRPGPVNMPQTAAIGGSFQAPRFTAAHHQSTPFDDSQSDMNSFAGMRYAPPMTAALDGRAPRFQQQQQQQMQLMQQAQLAAMSGMPGMMNSVDPAQAQLLQLQLMQAMIAQQQQAQKFQAEVALQHHMAMALNGQRQPTPRASNNGSRTAGPSQATFNLPPTLPGPVRHDHFGFEEEELDIGNSESASSWRRPSNAAPPVGLRNATPPTTIGRQSPPTNGVSSSAEVVGRYSPPEMAAPLPKYRPQPIRLRENASFAPSVTIDQEQGQPAYGFSKMVKPPSPTGSNSSGESVKAAVVPIRHSQPVRQPRGPPASVEELTMKNFARRTVRSTSNPMVILPEAQFVTAY
ncbi:hypothetical protein M408DRAFT_16638 [Serendipita vermifera MAFF 305830]|uniref:Uncharacterized protein n=1 Tax=Serendipita vermifera MAFF 305830 TaxID=933852 RepID=A0A0C3B852_SERVB|nr:hypothetical protein M408DRAFT_16638 [Serendipita vermifera MAFF 305830]